MHPEIEAHIEQTIRNHTALAVGGGLVPLPIVGLAAVTAIQFSMIHKIGEAYGQEVSEAQAKVWISALAGSSIARGAAEALKFLPGVGILGSITSAAFSGASTYAVGKVFAHHFANGGTIHNFDAEKFRDYYNEKFREGKNVADSIRKEQPDSETIEVEEIQDELTVKLSELQKLHKAGLITDEEFQASREKILSQRF